MKLYPKKSLILTAAKLMFCIFLLHLPSFSQTEQKPNETNLQPTQAGINLIHLGDIVDVDVIGSIEYDWRGTLTPEGFLKGFETIEDKIFALCRTEIEVARLIEKSYSKTLRNPQVVVKIVDRSNRPTAVVLGAVKKPQKFQIKREVSLNELLVLVGGFDETVSGEIEIVRPANLSCGNSVEKETDPQIRERFIKSSQDNGTQFINIKIADLLSGKKDANIQIMSGDIVTVSVSNLIYVIGGVSNPKPILFRPEMTLTRAIASAGGLSKDALPENITIFRKQGGNTAIINADLEKIKANQAEDVLLKAFDIIEVSQKGRDPRKFPPVLNINEEQKFDMSKMPVQIIE